MLNICTMESHIKVCGIAVHINGRNGWQCNHSNQWLLDVLDTRTGDKRVPADLLRRLLRKLDQLHYAAELDDMKGPPGNKLEALSGDRKGQHSICVNDQYRVCFEWTPQGPKTWSS